MGFAVYFDDLKGVTISSSPERSSLSDFLKAQQNHFSVHQKVLEYPHFIDENDPTVIPNKTERVNSDPAMAALDFHRFGVLSVIALALEGDVSGAYQLWLKMFKQDISHLQSARSDMSHLVAITAVRGDLELLLRLRMFSPPHELQIKIQEAVKNFESEKIDFHRALIFDYLFQYTTADHMFSEISEKGGLGRLVLNREVFLHEMNEYFRQLAVLWKDPKAMQAFSDEKLRELKKIKDPLDSLNELRHWWWLSFNPAKKVWRLQQAVYVRWSGEEFGMYKDKIIKLRARLLA